MTDERDDKLAADTAKLFAPGDLDAARSNIAAVSARTRRKHRLVASAGALAIVATIATGAATLDKRGTQLVTVGDRSSVDTSSTVAPTEVTTRDTVDGTTPSVAAVEQVEGMMFGSPHLQLNGEDLPRTEEGPGLPGVSLTFYRGTVTWNNGCYSLTGTYQPGAQTLTFPGPDRAIRPAIGCGDQELASLTDAIVLARPVRLETSSTPEAGVQLTVTGGPGTLRFRQQPYAPRSVHCVPGVDSRMEAMAATGRPHDDVAWSDPVAATRAHLAGNPDIYQDVELELTISNGNEALVTGTRQGRPVLSAMLTARGGTWDLTRYTACTPNASAEPAVRDTTATTTT